MPSVACQDDRGHREDGITARPRITTEQRRARLAVRHGLASRNARSLEDAAELVVGLHASDPVSVHLGAWTRTATSSVEAFEAELYDQRTVARVLGMRRTMFVVPASTIAVVHSAVTRHLWERERRRLIGFLEAEGVAADGDAWLSRVETETLAALHRLGEATASELTDVVPELSIKLTFGRGKTWSGQVGVSTRVLFLLATQGRIVRGRPRGSWLSSQYRWVPMDDWFPDGVRQIDADEARAKLARRWLARFGPGTLDDLKWWTGWTKTATVTALAHAGALEVDLPDGVTGYVERDEGEHAVPGPWVALLPSLDSTIMGWSDRDWYLGPHRAALFDRNGNAGPTAWVDGRVVGGWAQLGDGTVAIHLLEDVGREARTALEARAADLESFFGDTRITPRFRTPLEQQLTS